MAGANGACLFSPLTRAPTLKLIAMSAKPSKLPVKVVMNNRKARHDYEVLDTVEAGVALKGTEVKSVRLGNVNLGDSFCSITDKLEANLLNFHISPYSHGNRFNHEPGRIKKLLMHKTELRRLRSRINEKGLTLIPLSLYFKGDYLKVSLGVCKGKKLHDKRESLKKKDQQKEIDRLIK